MATNWIRHYGKYHYPVCRRSQVAINLDGYHYAAPDSVIERAVAETGFTHVHSIRLTPPHKDGLRHLMIRGLALRPSSDEIEFIREANAILA